MSTLYIGVMSGTSLDGADTVLVEVMGDGIELVAYRNEPYPRDLRAALERVIVELSLPVAELASLDSNLGEFFGNAVNALLSLSGHRADQVTAIGNHGQTIFHNPAGNHPATLQLGNPSIVAARTGITTVGHFRQLDLAYGGQGAPLAPIFHDRFLGSDHERRAVVNIGGIANVSVLVPGEAVVGFDTGPGNALMDAWSQRHLGRAFDPEGSWAASGLVHGELLKRLLADPYFSQPAPKSTGREYFHLAWLQQALADFCDLAPADIQATLAELTARSICEGVAAGAVERLLLCGGGIHNTHLVQRLTALMGDTPVQPTDDYGIPADWLEAMAFAWLAWARLHNRAGNLPSVTGARQSAVLGGVYLSK